MKLDFGLVRALLIHVGRQPQHDNLVDLSIVGYDGETVSDHVRLLDSLGYVSAVAVWTFQGEAWKSVRVTWKGADFLARASDDAVWNRARQMVEASGRERRFQIGIVEGALGFRGR